MKNLNLNAYGVTEMSHSEMVETDGGMPLLLALGLLVVGTVILAAANGYIGCSGSSSSGGSGGGGSAEIGRLEVPSKACFALPQLYY